MGMRVAENQSCTAQAMSEREGVIRHMQFGLFNGCCLGKEMRLVKMSQDFTKAKPSLGMELVDKIGLFRFNFGHTPKRDLLVENERMKFLKLLNKL